MGKYRGKFWKEKDINNEDIIYAVISIPHDWEIDTDGRIWKIKNGIRKRVENRTSGGYLQVRKMINRIRYHAGAHGDILKVKSLKA